MLPTHATKDEPSELNSHITSISIESCQDTKSMLSQTITTPQIMDNMISNTFFFKWFFSQNGTTLLTLMLSDQTFSLHNND